MRELAGQSNAKVPGTVEQAFALVRRVDVYPSWNSDLFADVRVLERDAEGDPVKAWAKLRVGRGRLGGEIELVVSVTGQAPNAVYIERLPNDPSDRERMELTWRLRQAGDTEISLDLKASVASLPSFVPIGRLGDQIAGSLVKSAAAALR